MTTLVTEQGIVHYETFGRGRPVLLLHGWLGSWELWRDTIAYLGQDFRTYALDFFGFGHSGYTDESFTIENYVHLVNQFMEKLGIVRAPLVGHSMGGTVSLSCGIRHPEKVVKVVVIGSPVQGTSLNLLLKLSGNERFAGLVWRFPYLLQLFLRAYSYFMAKDGQRLSNMMRDDITKVTANSFFESIGTLRQTDLRHSVARLQMPVMGIYGKNDIIVHPAQSKVLKQHVPHSTIDWFDHSGHFPMLDEPERFHQSLSHFLHNG